MAIGSGPTNLVSSDLGNGPQQGIRKLLEIRLEEGVLQKVEAHPAVVDLLYFRTQLWALEQFQYLWIVLQGLQLRAAQSQRFILDVVSLNQILLFALLWLPLPPAEFAFFPFFLCLHVLSFLLNQLAHGFSP